MDDFGKVKMGKICEVVEIINGRKLGYLGHIMRVFIAEVNVKLEKGYKSYASGSAVAQLKLLSKLNTNSYDYFRKEWKNKIKVKWRGSSKKSVECSH